MDVPLVVHVFPGLIDPSARRVDGESCSACGIPWRGSWWDGWHAAGVFPTTDFCSWANVSIHEKNCEPCNSDLLAAYEVMTA